MAKWDLFWFVYAPIKCKQQHICIRFGLSTQIRFFFSAFRTTNLVFWNCWIFFVILLNCFFRNLDLHAWSPNWNFIFFVGNGKCFWILIFFSKWQFNWNSFKLWRFVVNGTKLLISFFNYRMIYLEIIVMC